MKSDAETLRDKVEGLVLKGIKLGDYRYITEAMMLCDDESGVWMCEDSDFVMINDDVYYFNGAF